MPIRTVPQRTGKKESRAGSDRAWAELESQLKKQLLAALRGDQQAYSAFLGKVGSLVTSYLLKSARSGRGSSRSPGPEMIQDLAQDVLLSIHRKRDTYDQSLPVLPWVYAIARYRLIDSIRSESTQRLRALGEEESIEEIAQQSPEETGGGLNSLEIEEELHDALMGLTEKQKKILFLAKVEQNSLEEIGKQMGMSLANVKVTIHRTLQALRNRRNL